MKVFIQISLINSLGFLLAACPLFIIDSLARVLASIYLFLPTKRKELTRENIDKAFPKNTKPETDKLIFDSCRLSFEQGLLALAWSFIPTKKLLQRFTISEESKEVLRIAINSGRGVLCLVPHFCHAESISLAPSFLGCDKEIHALYRPFKNKALDQFIRKARQRFGMSLTGRKNGGLFKAISKIKQRETLLMLFDQNAGAAGTRMNFMQRECSCTTLPDVISARFEPIVLMVYSDRLGCFKSQIHAEEIDVLGNNESVMSRANYWLENKLRNDLNARMSWLWMHNRWKPGAGKIPTNS